ncbi:MAG: hypothetical protein M1400_01575 [Patescibacteria group bacterium]|nr:hypothetical protein [Patescibacteria group bacterium]
MEQFVRITKKALIYSSSHFGWWLLVLFQFAGFWLAGLGVKRIWHSPVYWLFIVLGLLLGAFFTTRLWLEIQAEYEHWAQDGRRLPGFFSVEFSWLALGMAGQMAAAGLLFWAVRTLWLHWAVRILVTSLCLVYFLGVQLFWVIFRQKLENSIRLSGELWQKRAQVPAASALVLMLANGLAFSLARIGLSSLFSEGFSDFGSSAKLWLLATLFLLLAVAIMVWLNNFLVIGFMEFVRTQKGKDSETVPRAAWLPAANK